MKVSECIVCECEISGACMLGCGHFGCSRCLAFKSKCPKCDADIVSRIRSKDLDEVLLELKRSQRVRTITSILAHRTTKQPRITRYRVEYSDGTRKWVKRDVLPKALYKEYLPALARQRKRHQRNRDKYGHLFPEEARGQQADSAPPQPDQSDQVEAGTGNADSSSSDIDVVD